MFMRRVFKSMFTVYIYKDQSLSRPIASDSDTLGWRGVWGGEDGGNLGAIVVRVCEPVFQNLPHSYSWPLTQRTHSYT